MKIVMILCLLIAYLMPIKASSVEINADSAYLMEYQSGKVIYEKNATEKMYPASMTKMMTLLLVFEAINQGKLNYDDQVVATSEACSMGGTQIYLKENELLSVKDLIYSIALASANDASVALAIHLKGTHASFVNSMNHKAKELKLTNTHFKNANGLHDDDHYSCAKDMAMIAKALINEGGSDLLKITSTYEHYIRKNTTPFWLVNTNKLLKSYQGVDGLKTGFTNHALSCISVTAKKNQVRLICVVMHAKDATTRNNDVIKLLDYGFQVMKASLLYDKNKLKKPLTIIGGNKKHITITNHDDIYIISDQEPKIMKQETHIIHNQAPITKNKIIAYEIITLSDQQIIKIPLYSTENINKESLFQLFVEQLLVLLF